MPATSSSERLPLRREFTVRPPAAPALYESGCLPLRSASGFGNIGRSVEEAYSLSGIGDMGVHAKWRAMSPVRGPHW